MMIKRFNLATLWISVGIWFAGLIVRLAALGIFTHAGYLDKLLLTAYKHPSQFVSGLAGWTILVITGAAVVMLLTERKRNRETETMAARLASML